MTIVFQSQRILVRVLAVALAATALSGCSRDMNDLEAYVEKIKERPGGRIEPLPQIKPYETFEYSAFDLREPFEPEVDETAVAATSTVRPDTTRNREYLEQFPLDTLRMVGTLDSGGTSYALLQTTDGLVHRVRPGNHIGQNEGRILSVSESEITLVEIVSDGLGGYIERPAAVALSE